MHSRPAGQGAIQFDSRFFQQENAFCNEWTGSWMETDFRFLDCFPTLAAVWRLSAGAWNRKKNWMTLCSLRGNSALFPIVQKN